MILSPLFATALAAAATWNPIEATTTTSQGRTIQPAVGEMAPEFDYLSSDYIRRRLRDVLREEGSVLLVFADTDAALRELQAHDADVRGAGLVRVAVNDLPARETHERAARLGLDYGVLSDPAVFVAAEYGMRDPRTGAMQNGWFVIDRSGRVRASGIGPIGERSWTAIATGQVVPDDVRAAR